MEMQEHAVSFFSDDGGLEHATACVAAVAELERASEKVGKPLNIAHLHKQWMIETGFQDVQEVVKKVRNTAATEPALPNRDRSRLDPG